MVEDSGAPPQAEPAAGDEAASSPPVATKQAKCKLCRCEVPLTGQDIMLGQPTPGRLYLCERCTVLQRAPPCIVCGEPVRDASRSDPEPIHKGCRRCSSCCQFVAKKDARKLVGRLLCPPCWQLFRKFFTPERRAPADHVREVFNAWDQDGSGVIEKEEVKRVLHALDPNLSERDLDKLIHSIDTNHNNVIEIEEFMAWLQSDPNNLGEEFEDSFANFVRSLMRESGGAARHAAICLAEVIMRPDGIMFVLRSGDERLESRAIRSRSAEVATFDAEEFMTGIECTDKVLKLILNTGRVATLPCDGTFFGPWHAPVGFHIIGLRTKPTDTGDRIVGVSFAPMAAAKNYDSLAALQFAAEQEYLQPLSEMLSKASINVNGFGMTCGNVSALMLAAQSGAVGAMRMLLTSKANPDLEDDDGWTALTFASRCGQGAAVNALLEQQKRLKASRASKDGSTAEDSKDSEEKHNRAMAALREAVRHKHNAVARMLLRAGLGPAPAGAFSIEEIADPSHCTLDPPTISPASGVFSTGVVVKMKWTKPRPEGASNKPDDGTGSPSPPSSPARRAAEVTLMYTLDGRDPAMVGQPYGGPIHISNPHVCVRAMVKQGNGNRSKAATASYVISHYVVPDEITSGEMKVRIFPEALSEMQEAFASLLGIEASSVHVSEKGGTSDEDMKAQGRWLWMRVQDKLPEYRLIFDTSMSPWASAKAKKKKKFLEQFLSDVNLATGEKPEKVAMDDLGQSLNVFSFHIDFALPFAEGEILRSQLADSRSKLRTRGQLRDLYDKTELEMVNTLADTLSNPEYQLTLKDSLCKSANTKGEVDLFGIGKADGGLVAVVSSKENIKKLSKVFEKSVKGSVYKFSTQLGAVQDSLEMVDLHYAVDIMGPSKSHSEGAHLDGGAAVEALNSPDFAERLSAALTERHLPAALTVKQKATSRCLHDVEVALRWASKPRAQQSQVHLDGHCYFYMEQELARVVDMRSLQARGSTEITYNVRRKSIANKNIAINPVEGAGSLHYHRISIDLLSLPLEITEVFFVLSAGDADDLSSFQDITMELWDYQAHRLLCTYCASPVGTVQSIVVSCLSRTEHGIWIHKALSMPSAGSAKDLTPIADVISRYQGAGYSTWERRGTLVKLRVMRRLQYAQQGSTGKFAQLLWQVLSLPTPAFQLIVTSL